MNLNEVDVMNLGKPSEDDGKGGKNSNLTLKVPGPDNPLIIKLVPTLKGLLYQPVEYYKYQVGPNPQTDSRSRPSAASLGLADKDIENEEFWKNVKELSALKKAGMTKEAPQFKAIQQIVKMYEPSKGGWLYYYEPDSPTIKALKLNPSMINTLFGRKGEGQIKDIPSIVDAIHKRGMSPYKPSNTKCWLKIYKTGEKLATEYHVELFTTTEHDSEGNETKKNVERPVHAKFLDAKTVLTTEDYPDTLSFDQAQLFTDDETKEFIKTNGIVTPERFNRKARNTDEASTDVSTTTVANVVSSLSLNISDIPF